MYGSKFWCVINTFGRILCHLVLLLDVATLFVEGNVGITTVQDGLITAAVLTDMCESLDDTEAKFLALLAFVDGDVLDVTDTTETAEELALDEDGAYFTLFGMGMCGTVYGMYQLTMGKPVRK